MPLLEKNFILNEKMTGEALEVRSNKKKPREKIEKSRKKREKKERKRERREKAVLYYTSCWDCVGMKFDFVGIDPNSRHPKPRPTTPQDLFKIFLFLYQKENFRNT